METTAQAPATVFGALSYGLPALLLHFGLVLALLIVGIFVYMAVTPFHERELLRAGNTAAATVLGGAAGGAGDPARRAAGDDRSAARYPGLGHCRGHSAACHGRHPVAADAGMRTMIEAGKVAAAIPLVGRANLDRPVERGRDGASLIDRLVHQQELRMLGFLQEFCRGQGRQRGSGRRRGAGAVGSGGRQRGRAAHDGAASRRSRPAGRDGASGL